MYETVREWAMFVKGVPVAQGSTRAFVPKTGRMQGRPIITTTSKGLAAWRTLVALRAQEFRDDAFPIEGPVSLELRFFLPRPKSEPKRRATFPDRLPDCDKLVRAVFDALEGVCYRRDSQVVHVDAWKFWADDPHASPRWRSPPGVFILFRSIERARGVEEHAAPHLPSMPAPRTPFDSARAHGARARTVPQGAAVVPAAPPRSVSSHAPRFPISSSTKGGRPGRPFFHFLR
jgi:Holliday junction resolvase RusA-like endonuclease